MAVVVEEITADVGIACFTDHHTIAPSAHDVVMDEVVAYGDLLYRCLVVRCLGDVHGGGGPVKDLVVVYRCAEDTSIVTAPLPT